MCQGQARKKTLTYERLKVGGEAQPQPGCTSGMVLGVGAGEGIQPPGGLLGRYQALRGVAGGSCPAIVSFCEGNEPGGIRTRGALIKRYLALNGVAARTARGAKAVQLSTRQMAL